MMDAIVIGVGPAGISTAINLRKLNLSVLVLGKDKGQLSNLDVIDNLYGHGPIAGEQLITKGIMQSRQLGIEVKNESVLNIEDLSGHFVVTTTHQTYEAKTVVLATGKPRVQINLEGYQTFKSKGIHLCTTCDGLFYKNKKVALIGNGAYLEHELETLENYTKDIMIFTNGLPYTHKKYPVIKDKLVSFIGEKRLTHIKTTNDSYQVNGVFLAISHPMATELSLKLGVLMKDDNIVVDNYMQTNIKGLFAAGDCVGGMLQIPKAIHDGFMAAHGINQYLRGSSHGNNKYSY